MGHLRQHSLQTYSHLREDIRWSYKSVKRGLQECQKRPTRVSKEAYKSVKSTRVSKEVLVSPWRQWSGKVR
jgi:hypothetical protein